MKSLTDHECSFGLRLGLSNSSLTSNATRSNLKTAERWSRMMSVLFCFVLFFSNTAWAGKIGEVLSWVGSSFIFLCFRGVASRATVCKALIYPPIATILVSIQTSHELFDARLSGRFLSLYFSCLMRTTLIGEIGPIRNDPQTESTVIELQVLSVPPSESLDVGQQTGGVERHFLQYYRHSKWRRRLQNTLTKASFQRYWRVSFVVVFHLM